MSALDILLGEAAKATGHEWSGSDYERIWTDEEIAEARAELAALRAKVAAAEAVVFATNVVSHHHQCSWWPGDPGTACDCYRLELDAAIAAYRSLP